MKSVLCVLVGAIVCAGCGKNLAGPEGTPLLLPPGGLTALSVDSAHVRLGWIAPSGAADTTFAGYVIRWGSVADTIAGGNLLFTAGPLARGAATFSISSLQKGGEMSSAATITWAPAWRFDASPIVLTEYNSALQTGVPGISVGTGTTDPQSVGLLDADAGSLLDFYIYGAGGDTLDLVSAGVYNAGWHQTLFSTTTTASPDLNAPLASFPPDNSFADRTMTVRANTIYYLKIPGNSGETYYARIHVEDLGGTFPNRQIGIRISLQRVSQIPYA